MLIFHQELDQKSGSIIISQTFDEKDKFDKIALFKVVKIIGEYSKDFSGDIKNCFPNFPWSELKSIRDIMEHPDGIVIDIINGSSQDQVIKSIYEAIQNYFLPELESIRKEINNNKSFKNISKALANNNADYSSFAALKSLIETTKEHNKANQKPKKKFTADKKMIEDFLCQNLYNDEEKNFLDELKKLDPKIDLIKNFLVKVGYTIIPNDQFSKKIQNNQGLPKDQKEDLAKFIKESIFKDVESLKDGKNLKILSSKIRKFPEIEGILGGKEIKSVNELTDLLKKEGIEQDEAKKISENVKSGLNIKKQPSKIDLMVEQLDDFLLLIEEKVSKGDSYVNLIRNHGRAYLTIQGLIENLMDAPNKSKDSNNKEFNYSYDTISPRRIQLLRIFRHGIAHSSEKVNDDLFEKFFRDLASLTKIDFLRRRSDIEIGDLEKDLSAPKRIDVINDESGAIILANAKKFGFDSKHLRAIGKEVGCEIGPGCDIDLVVEYDQQLKTKDVETANFRLIEFELELGKLLNCYVRVRDWESLEKEVGVEFSERHLKSIKESSETVSQLLIEEQFREDLQSGAATRFLFLDTNKKPKWVSKGESDFTEENIEKALTMTFAQTQESYDKARKVETERREKQLKDYPELQKTIESKSLILTNLIKHEKERIGDERFGKLLNVFHIDKEIDELTDKYFLSHQEEILKLYDASKDKNDFAMAKYNFRREIRAKNFVFVKDEKFKKEITSKIEKREGLIQESCNSYTENKAHPNYNIPSQLYAIKSDDGNVYITKENEADIQIFADARNQMDFVKEIDKRSNVLIKKVPSIDRVITVNRDDIKRICYFSMEERRIIQFWKDYKFISLLFDEISNPKTIQATSNDNYDEIGNDLTGKFCDPSDFLQFIVTRDDSPVKLHRMPLYKEVTDSHKLETSEISLIPSNEIEYVCLDKASQSAINYARNSRETKLANPDLLIHFENMGEKFDTLRDRHYDRAQTLNVIGKSIMSPDVGNLSDILGGLNLDKKYYPDDFDKDNENLVKYLEFKNLFYIYGVLYRREEFLSNLESKLEFAKDFKETSEVQKEIIKYELGQVENQNFIVYESRKSILEDIFKCDAIQEKFQTFQQSIEVDNKLESKDPESQNTNHAKLKFLDLLEKEMKQILKINRATNTKRSKSSLNSDAKQKTKNNVARSSRANQYNMDAFNYVSNHSNLTHQNVYHLIRESFIASGIGGGEYDRMNREGTINISVINDQNESLDCELRDAILKFIGRGGNKASIALCRGVIGQSGQIEGNTHWTALHLRKVANEDGSISIQPLHADSMGSDVPDAVNRVLNNIQNMSLDDLNADLQNSLLYQRAIHNLTNISFKPCKNINVARQEDGYSCGYHSVFNMAAMHNRVNIDNILQDSKQNDVVNELRILQNSTTVNVNDFIANGRRNLQEVFNGQVNNRRNQNKGFDSKNNNSSYLNEDLRKDLGFAMALTESILISEETHTEKLEKLINIENYIRNGGENSIINVLSNLNIRKLYNSMDS